MKKIGGWFRLHWYIFAALVGLYVSERGIIAAGFYGLYPLLFVGYCAMLYGYPGYRKSKEVDRELEKMLAGAEKR